MSKSALIVIDVQSGMYDSEKIPPIFEGERKIKSIRHLIEKARNRGISIIYVQHAGDKGHPLKKGTKGWEIHDQIQPFREDLIIEKKHPDAFLNTRLVEVLAELSVINLYIVGNQTEYCIDTTCRSAFAKGFQVLLIEDCHSTWDSDILSASEIIEHHNETLSNGFLTTKNSKDLSFDEFN